MADFSLYSQVTWAKRQRTKGTFLCAKFKIKGIRNVENLHTYAFTCIYIFGLFIWFAYWLYYWTQLGGSLI